MSVSRGDIVWEATPARKAATNLSAFLSWLGERGHAFQGYDDLWHWSVGESEDLWAAIWDYFDVISEGERTAVMTDAPMPRTRWFTGTRLNYAEHVLRHVGSGDPSRPMLRHYSELRDPGATSWAEVDAAVRQLATRMRAMGIGKGDRVAAYLPNLPETVIAMLATTAIGAIWSSAAPEFGAQTVIDRFGQIGPKLVFACNGYRYGGRDHDRTSDLATILKALPGCEFLVMLDYLPSARSAVPFDGETIGWQDMLSGPHVTAADFCYERVTSDHPLWVLFSSGTTGLPKAIVHGHHGIVLEHYKSAAFHFEIQPGGSLFFYSTTGWMVWNTLIWGPLMNGEAILYDGHPTFPDERRLWQIADEAGATVMGVNPTFIQRARQGGFSPRASFGLERLETLLLVGSPATPEDFEWVLAEVKPTVWPTSQSGGTEFCSGLLAGSPLLPTRAGEIQAAGLGTDACAFDASGKPVIGEDGELVIRSPMPSMPLFLWGDEGFVRYCRSYFEEFPGVWAHGDRARFIEEGGVMVLGRSDATLNRFGVRIGSAEIYQTVEKIDGIADSLIICVEDGSGGYHMPLFVQLAEGRDLDDGLIDEIRRRLRTERSPRHLPDQITAAPGIPQTLTGKKMEVPVRKLFLGAPIDQVAGRGATRNPETLEWFAARATEWACRQPGKENP